MALNSSIFIASSSLRQLTRTQSIGRPLARAPKFFITRNYSDSRKSVDCEKQECDETIERMDNFSKSQPATSILSMHFQKHWAECPEPPKSEKLSCEDYAVPPHEGPKRPRKSSSSSFPSKKFKPSAGNDCQTIGEHVCRKISLKNCRKAKNPPKCTKKYVMKNCEKILAPTLSFSEMCRFKVPDPNNECNCFRPNSICVYGNEV